MNHLFRKYLLSLIVLLHYSEFTSGTSYPEELVFEETDESPFQTETYSGDLYSSDNIYSSENFYEQNIRAFGFGGGGEDDFDDDGGTENPDDAYNDAPAGDSLLPLCLLIAAYSVWKRRRRNGLQAQ